MAALLAAAGLLLHASRLRRVRQRFCARREASPSRASCTTRSSRASPGSRSRPTPRGQHLARRPEAVERSLDTALRMVEYSREETRRTVNQLRSQALEKGDIAQAVREVARELTAGGGPRVSVEVSGAPRRLSVAAEHHLFRIAQEALTNALTHARASRVSVAIDFAADAVALSVSDDGRGLPADPSGGFHFGLSGMRERARALGTRLEVESAPGAGTSIRVRLSGASTREGAPEA
ncbi:MAG: sensor histidine kinase [Vicinamibacteria bacterium]